MKVRAAWLSLLLVTATGAARGDQVVKLTTGERTLGSWVIDEEGEGAVFGVAHAEGKVVEFDPRTGAERRSLAFPFSSDTRLAVKARRLLVVDPRRQSVLAVDLERWARAYELVIDGAHTVLTAPDGAPPWAWIVARTDGGRARVVRLDVTRGVLEHDVGMPPVELVSMSDIGVSRDGTLLLVRRRGSFELRSLAPDGTTWPVALLEHGGVNGWLTACRRLWVTGNRVFDETLATRGVVWSTTPALHPRRDLAVGPQQAGFERRLGVFRASTAEQMATIVLGDSGGTTTSPQRVLVDGRNDRALCTWDDGAYVVDLSGVTVPQGLLLRATPTVGAVTVGLEATFSVDVAEGPPATLTLVDPPPGVSLDQGKLSWRPTTAQVGRHRLRVQGRRGDAEDALAIPVEVRHPAIGVGFPIHSLLTDGKARLLAVGARPLDQNLNVSREPPWLALIDVGRRQVVGRRRLDQPFQALALGRDAVFVLQRRPDVLLRLRGTDLEEEGRGFHRELEDFDALADRLVGQGTGGVTVLDPRTFEELWRLPSSPLQYSRIERTPDGGAILGGRAYIRPDGTFGALQYPVSDAPGTGRLRSASQPPQAGRLSNLPLVVTVEPRQVPEGTAFALEARDLAGARVHAGPVTTLPVYTPVVDRHGQVYVPLAGIDCGVAIALGDQVHLVPLPPALAASTPPLALVPGSERPLVARSEGGLVQVAFRPHGGRGPYVFELEDPLEGVSIDPRTGLVSIDAAGLWARHLRGVQPHAHQEPAPVRLLLAAIGAEPDRAPVQATFAVVVRDAQQQRARCPYVAVVVGPRDELERARKEGAARTADVGAGDVRAHLARQEQELRAMRLALDGPQVARRDQELRANLEATRADLARHVQELRALRRALEDVATEGSATAAVASAATRDLRALRVVEETVRRDLAAQESQARVLAEAVAAQGSRGDMALGLGAAGLAAGLLGLALARRAPAKARGNAPSAS